MPRPKKILSPEQLAENEAKAARKEATKIKKDCLARICKKDALNPFTWARELKIINQLVEIYPNLNFWRNFSMEFQLNSSAWLLTDKGKDYLAQEYRRQTTDLSSLTQRQELPPLENNVVEKIEISKRILTLKGFLKP